MTSESTSSLKVLVAEDEPAMLSLVGRHMKSLGFNVVEASDGDMAWDLAAKHHPDLVILDVMMPGMSGWEICKRLKSDTSDGRPFANTGVIMLTGIGENLNEMTSPLFAADAWLNKPFDFGELDSKVRETLTQYGKALPSPLSDGGRGAASSSAASPSKERASGGAETSNTDIEQEGGGMASKMANAVVKKAAAVVHKVAGAVKKAVEPAKKAASTAKKTTAKKAAGAKKTAKKAVAGAKKVAKKAVAGAKKVAKKAAPAAKKAAAKKTASKKSASKKSASSRKSAS